MNHARILAAVFATQLLIATPPAQAAQADSPTPGPACTAPNKEVTVTKAVPPTYPQSAMSANLGNVGVDIDLTLSATGEIESAVIEASSNNMAIDKAALVAAKASLFAPKIVSCVPVEGHYLFHAEFMTGSP